MATYTTAIVLTAVASAIWEAGAIDPICSRQVASSAASTMKYAVPSEAVGRYDSEQFPACASQTTGSAARAAGTRDAIDATTTATAAAILMLNFMSARVPLR